MTVNTTSNKIIYLGNGATTSFTFPYPGVAVGDIEVFTTDPNGNVVQQAPTAFAVTLNPPQGSNPTGVGGTVTYPLSGSPLAVGWSITILRSLLDVQETSLLNQGTMYPPAIEQALDYLTMLVQQQDEFNSRAITVPVSDPIPPPLPAIAFRKNTGFIFDSNGNPAVGTLPSGGVISAAWQPIVSSAAVLSGREIMGVGFPNRAAIQATTIATSVNTIYLDGWHDFGDMGKTSTYVRGGPTGLAAIQSADGAWWNLAFAGSINLVELGAGFSVAADDVAAMTAALAATYQSHGAYIYLPPGVYFLGTGQFTISQHNTKIIGAGTEQTFINFSPAGTAVLFNLDATVAVPNGLAFVEISGMSITGGGTAIKTAINTRNTTFLTLSKLNITNFTNSTAQCIGLSYAGRNFCILEDSQIDADNPVFFALNPYRSLVQFEDADFFVSRRNQLNVTDPTITPAAASNSVYTTETDTSGPNHTSCNITNFSDTDSDWARGRIGFNYVAETNDGTQALAGNFYFKGIRYEQQKGALPLMFVFLMSNSSLMDGLVIDNCESSQGFADLSGVINTTVRNSRAAYGAVGAIGVFQTDSTCHGIRFDGFEAAVSSTINMAGQVLVRGSYSTGPASNQTFPAYALWASSVEAQAQVELVGITSANNGRQTYEWFASIDLAAGASSSPLLPFANFTVVWAEIHVSGNGPCGIAIFESGSPGSTAVLVGQTNFAVDGNTNHLSVFYNSNSSVQIVNKIAGSSQPVTVTLHIIFTV